MRILIFGDSIGIPQLLRFVPKINICGLVVASIRPQYHSEIKGIADKMKIPFLIQPLPSSGEYKLFKKGVESLAPELSWVNSYSMILHDDVLGISSHGGINIHGALLPQYRGCNPTEWAIINGENETGVTLHEMSTGIDEGNIIAQYKVPLHSCDTWRSATDRIYLATDFLIKENLESILNKSWSSFPQETDGAKYYRRRYFEDGRFDWSQPAYEIYNLVRALVKPHPGASYIGINGSIELLSSYKSIAEISAMKFMRLKNAYSDLNSLQLCPILAISVHQPLDIKIHKSKLSIKKMIELISPVDKFIIFENFATHRCDQINFLVWDQNAFRFIGIVLLTGINIINKNANVKIEISYDYKDKLNALIALVNKFGSEELGLQKLSILKKIPKIKLS